MGWSVLSGATTSARGITAGLIFLMASVQFVAGAPLLSEPDVVAHVEANLARYMMEQPDRCTTATKEVEQNEIVAPYVEALAEAGSNADGVRIAECTYEYSPMDGGAKQEGYAILLDLPASVIGRWIYNACKAEAPSKLDGCARQLVSEMISNSGGQYPISGFVSEGPNDGLCKQHGKAIKKQGLIAFRDGVTIQFNESSGGAQPIYYCTTDPIPINVQKHLIIAEPATSVYNVARLAAIRRDCWGEYLSNQATGTLKPSAWQELARTTMLNALKSGHDSLFEFKARTFASTGKTCQSHS